MSKELHYGAERGCVAYEVGVGTIETEACVECLPWSVELVVEGVDGYSDTPHRVFQVEWHAVACPELAAHLAIIRKLHDDHGCFADENRFCPSCDPDPNASYLRRPPRRTSA